MRENFDLFWPRLLDEEGRTLDTDKRDPGNWTGGEVGVGRLVGTKFGIDAASHWREVDIPSLTEIQAKAIYRRAYATPVHFDELPAGVDVVVFDTGVNSGVHKAGVLLQQAVGLTGDDVDGWIGPKTIKATLARPPGAIIIAILDARLAYLKTLRIWPTYKGGWTTRVVDLKAYALKLSAQQGASP